MIRSVRFLLSVVLAIGAVLPIVGVAQTNPAGAVFVMTNGAVKNQIVTYSRNANGWLQPGQTFSTGGRGSGGVTDPLASQGALTLSHDHSLLFAVNAGSGNVSVFQVSGSILPLLTRHPLAPRPSRSRNGATSFMSPMKEPPATSPASLSAQTAS